ncbi:hypothetical protein [Sphingobium xenophagum]|nr:hypothetical protein [Sphingobium xenophagum]
METAATHELTLPGAMLRRGFWLYVWRVETASGDEWLYVGRTGDNSSPHASAPYTRMGQHLGTMKNQNALRARLRDRGIEAEDCLAFHLIAHGPLHPEVEKAEGALHAELMSRHMPLRDEVGAYERDLAAALGEAGYQVLNTVRWRHSGDPERWALIRAAFADHFPKLRNLA